MADTRLFPLSGAVRRHPEVDRWVASRSREFGEIARERVERLRNLGEDVADLLHDGHPTACVVGLAFAYVNAFSEHVNVGFYLGSSLEDPSALLQGTGRFMRHVKIRPGEPLDGTALQGLILAAYQDMKTRSPAN